MKFLVDTNVVSELRKGERADSGVRRWFASVEEPDLALSVLVLGEIRTGIYRLGRRDPETAAHLAAWLDQIERDHRARALPVDDLVVEAWARLNVPRPLPVIDSLQAATALVHSLTFVTRNTGDLDGVDVPLLNPFDR